MIGARAARHAGVVRVPALGKDLRGPIRLGKQDGRPTVEALQALPHLLGERGRGALCPTGLQQSPRKLFEIV